jgi:GDP-mannose 6-dehydrogenase
MKISVFGMGYVGVVSAACLSADGNEVVGVDPNRAEVDLINRGLPPIIEKDIHEMIGASVSAGRLRGTTDVGDAVRSTEISLICVGTSFQLNGNLDLSFVRRVCEEIGRVLKDVAEFHVVVVRSTMLPGSTRGTVIPTLEAASGKRALSIWGCQCSTRSCPRISAKSRWASR